MHVQADMANGVDRLLFRPEPLVLKIQFHYPVHGDICLEYWH